MNVLQKKKQGPSITNHLVETAGVAVGAGWQSMVALLNTGCYYIVGLPIGAVLGYVFKLGVKGIWSGMLLGSLLQTVILLIIIIRTNWSKEVSQNQ